MNEQHGHGTQQAIQPAVADPTRRPLLWPGDSNTVGPLEPDDLAVVLDGVGQTSDRLLRSRV